MACESNRRSGPPATRPRSAAPARRQPDLEVPMPMLDVYVAEVTEAVLDAEEGARPREEGRVWVVPTEIPEGHWGGNGRITPLAAILERQWRRSGIRRPDARARRGARRDQPAHGPRVDRAVRRLLNAKPSFSAERMVAWLEDDTQQRGTSASSRCRSRTTGLMTLRFRLSLVR